MNARTLNFNKAIDFDLPKVRSKLALAILIAILLHPSARADFDYVVGGSMSMNLDSAALRDPASVDAAYLAGFGVIVDPSQPLLIFGNHFGSTDTAGKSLPQFRPLPVDASLAPISVPGPALPRPNYRDDVPTIEASISAFGSTSGLAYGINGQSVTPSGLPGRSEQSSTFSFDPSNLPGTASGVIGLDGVTSLWYANTPVINTGSVWLAYGDLALAYDAARAINGDSGWVLINHLLFDQPVYDIQNFAVSNIVDATVSTPGSFTITGDLFTSQEFRDGFGIAADYAVGSFTLNAVTAVPEASSLVLAGVAALGAGVFCARRSRFAAKHAN